MTSSFCSDCKRNVYAVLDHSSGDTICTECGLVLEAYYIDETSEWRTFSDDTGSDPNRVGEALNPLLRTLTTTISKGKGSQEGASALGKWQNHGSDPDRCLIEAFSSMGVMADRLELVNTIKDRANEIFKSLTDLKTTKGRKQDSVLAACLFTACRLENKPRTVNEILSAVPGTISKKELGRAIQLIGKNVEQQEPRQTVTPKDFLKRFCNFLNMNHQDANTCNEIAQRIQEVADVRRSPVSLAAAIIYMVTVLKGPPKTLKDISRIAGVAENTIKLAYNDIRSFGAKVVPKGFVQPEELQKLKRL